jgi:Lon protease-like protein
MPDTIIPLFPLSIVVFPEQAVPLHIFEERYKAMIADCRGEEIGGVTSPFGISLQGQESVHEVGCSVLLHQVLREYEDGRLDLIAVGSRRYRCVDVFDDKPYFTAAVEYFEDEPEKPQPDLAENTQAMVMELLAALKEQGDRPAEEELPSGSFQLATRISLTTEQKQQLLEITSENQRLEVLTGHLENLIPAVHEHQENLRKVRANGRPKKS